MADEAGLMKKMGVVPETPRAFPYSNLLSVCPSQDPQSFGYLGKDGSSFLEDNSKSCLREDV
jgi:hypothetical protein